MGLTYTIPKRREVLRFLRARKRNGAGLADDVLLSRYGLEKGRIHEYLEDWGKSLGEDLSDLAETPKPKVELEIEAPPKPKPKRPKLSLEKRDEVSQ